MNFQHRNDDDGSLIQMETKLDSYARTLGIDTMQYKRLPLEAKLQLIETTVNDKSMSNDQRKSDKIRKRMRMKLLRKEREADKLKMATAIEFKE